jgi:hypothetical protein
MAVTITQSPQAYTPSDNPVTWVFSSDQTAQPNFYFLIEVEIGNPTLTVVEKHKAYVEQGTNAHFDASGIVERYAVVNDRQLNQVLNQVRINVIEKYNGGTGATATSSIVKFFKAKLRKKDFVSYDYNDYLLDSAGVKFLTFTPRGTDKARGTEKKFLSILSDGNAPTFQYKTYTSSDILIDTQSQIASTDNLINVSCGVQDLIDDFSLNFTNASYYTVEATNSGGSTEVYRIDIDTDCIYSTSKRILWLNTLGGVDAFTFGLISRERSSVTSFGYERQFGNFTSAGAFEYDLKEGTVIDYLKQSNKSLEVVSDWLNQTTQNWLVDELYMSPVIWFQDDREIYRCKVTNRSYEKKIQENDTLFQETVQIELESDTSVNV